MIRIHIRRLVKQIEGQKTSLIEEYSHVRESTISLFKSFTNEMLLQSGKASGGNMSVRAIGFIVIGHENHHCQVIRERYL